MNPTLGRIVIYKMTENEKNQVNGNRMNELPAIITAVWSDTSVNLKIITDGVNDLWLTSKSIGDLPGNWNWPNMVKS